MSFRGEDSSLDEEKKSENEPVSDNTIILDSAIATSETMLGVAHLSSILYKLVEDTIRTYKNPERVISNWSPLRYIQIFYELFPNEKLASSSDELIVFTCMKYIIGKYDFFFPEGFANINKIYTNMVVCIKENMEYVLKIKDRVIKNRAKPKIKVFVQCSYKQLKSIFYNGIENPNQSIVNLTLTDENIIPDISNISANDILHWPHVAVTVAFPNFEATRHNLHRSDFKLIRYTNDYVPNVDLNRNLRTRYKSALGRYDSFFTKFISAYITQLREMIRMSSDITSSKKVDMLSILSEFMTDFEFIDVIDVETEYYIPLAKMPYIRYLAKQRRLPQGSLPVEADSAKVSLVRLQETINPLVMFKLKKFRVPFEMDGNDEHSIRFQMDKEYLSKNQWLIFTCLLCDVRYEGFLATYEMALHLFGEHGIESDWKCTLCHTSFSMIFLSSQRWQHSCPREPFSYNIPFKEFMDRN